MARSCLVAALCVFVVPRLAAQTNDLRPTTTVTGVATVTNKGMSTIPALTLGKPAALFYLYVRHGRFGLDPEVRWGLDGKPWAVLFWGRYRMQHDRWSLGIGGHPALNLKAQTVTLAGSTREIIVGRRYLVGELTPTYSLNARANVGVTYLYLHGVESDVARHTHFVSLRSLVNVPLGPSYSLRLTPQTYYLWMARREGYYVYSAATLARRSFPVSLSASVNDPLRSKVPGGTALVWNASANYAIP
ncbi:MAG TPA: hypothetical protein VJ867_02705 [Gemmatimonadaceae bacterium]|nr:hypothetical protein [Gemmatimonadaceae bacterium]